MPNDNKVRSLVAVTHNGRTVTVTDAATISLSGDRRKWPKELEELLVLAAKENAKMIANRILGDTR